MESPTGLIPEELLFPNRKKDVIAFLQAQAWPGDFKRRVFEGYLLTVGIRARPREFRLIEMSGADREEPFVIP